MNAYIQMLMKDVQDQSTALDQHKHEAAKKAGPTETVTETTTETTTVPKTDTAPEKKIEK